MSLWDIFSKIGLLILCGAIFYFVFDLSLNIWSFAETICSFIKEWLEKITKPFNALWKFTRKKLSFLEVYLKKDIIARFAGRHPILGSATSIRLFIPSFIFLAVIITIYIAKGAFGDFLENTISMLPIFFVMNIILGRVQFTFVALISTGVSSMLIGLFYSLCMGNYSRKGSFVRWMVSICYYIVTTFVACYISFALSNVWEWIAHGGIALFGISKDMLTTSSWTFVGILKIIGCAISLLAILYTGIILILIAANEYIEAICYGSLGLILIAMVYIIFSTLSSEDFFSSHWGTLIFIITTFISVFGVDFLRVNKSEILEKILEEEESEEENEDFVLDGE